MGYCIENHPKHFLRLNSQSILLIYVLSPTKLSRILLLPEPMKSLWKDRGSAFACFQTSFHFFCSLFSRSIAAFANLSTYTLSLMCSQHTSEVGSTWSYLPLLLSSILTVSMILDKCPCWTWDFIRCDKVTLAISWPRLCLEGHCPFLGSKVAVIRLYISIYCPFLQKSCYIFSSDHFWAKSFSLTGSAPLGSVCLCHSPIEEGCETSLEIVL